MPALNTDPAFIEDMADMVVEALALPTLTVSEVRFDYRDMVPTPSDIFAQLLRSIRVNVFFKYFSVWVSHLRDDRV